MNILQVLFGSIDEEIEDKTEELRQEIEDIKTRGENNV